MSSNILHDLKEIVSLAVGVMALVIYIISLGYMLYSPFYIIHHINQPDFYNILYVLVPIPVGIVELVTIAAYGWYIFLVVAVSISAYFMFRKGILPYIKSVASDMFSYKQNPFQDVVELLSLSLFITIVAAFLYMLFAGSSPPTPPLGEEPLYERMMLLLNASVYEELITRTVFLGIPLYVYYKFFQNKNISFIKIFGGTKEIGYPEIFFILFSAIIFGVAHVPGWTWWKFIPAFIAGIAFGYVYVRYGIYASITMHFLNDFSSIPADVYPQFTLVYTIIFIGFAIVGVVFLISRLIRVFQFFGILKRPSATQEPVLPPPPPPLWVFPEESENIATTPDIVLPSSDVPSVNSYPQRDVIREENTNLFPIPRNFTPSPAGEEWINIICPVCGGREFRYEGKGKLRCVQCGKIIDVHEYQEQSHQ